LHMMNQHQLGWGLMREYQISFKFKTTPHEYRVSSEQLVKVRLMIP